MRTFIIIFFILTLLAGLIIGEQLYVGKFCDNFLDEISGIKTNLERGNVNENMGKDIVKIWEKNRHTVFMFANHNNFKDIESAIYDIKYYIDKNNADNASFFTNSLYYSVKELRESTKCTFENIL